MYTEAILVAQYVYQLPVRLHCGFLSPNTKYDIELAGLHTSRLRVIPIFCVYLVTLMHTYSIWRQEVRQVHLLEYLKFPTEINLGHCNICQFTADRWPWYIFEHLSRWPDWNACSRSKTWATTPRDCFNADFRIRQAPYFVSAILYSILPNQSRIQAFCFQAEKERQKSPLNIDHESSLIELEWTPTSVNVIVKHKQKDDNITKRHKQTTIFSPNNSEY